MKQNKIILVNDDEFILIRSFKNSKLLKEYKTDYETIFSQMCLDAIKRTPIYINENKVNSMDDLLKFIHNEPYLKSEQILVYLFLSQTMMSLPLELIVKILKKQKSLVICEPDSKERLYSIKLDPFSIFIEKKMRACKVDIEPVKIMDIDIEIDVDFMIGETTIYIKGELS